MSRYLAFVLLITIIQGCHKKDDGNNDQGTCDMRKVEAINAGKVSITNTGNCMPIVGMGKVALLVYTYERANKCKSNTHL